MSRWVLHDAEHCITDMLWTQATHKLPHVFLPKQAVIIQAVCVSRCDCMLTLLALLQCSRASAALFAGKFKSNTPHLRDEVCIIQVRREDTCAMSVA
jgi:hypothetical protein